MKTYEEQTTTRYNAIITALRRLGFIASDGVTVGDRGYVQLEGEPLISVRTPRGKDVSQYGIDATKLVFDVGFYRGRSGTTSTELALTVDLNDASWPEQVAAWIPNAKQVAAGERQRRRAIDQKMKALQASIWAMEEAIAAGLGSRHFQVVNDGTKAKGIKLEVTIFGDTPEAILATLRNTLAASQNL